MRGRSQAAVRAVLRARFGIWRLYELRNKVLRWPGAVRSTLAERREVSRLAPTVVVPPALVATIIPTCDRPETLRRAVRSALAQTVEDHVVVVVDDGAGLPFLPLDGRLFAVSLSRNTGCAGLVRNVGMALTTSAYVAFLDDDNEWRPHHLAVAIEALEQGADLVYTGVERVHPDGTVLDVLARPFDRRALAEEAFVDTNSIVVRRGPGVRFSRLPRTRATLPKEDWELVWRLSRTRRTRHVPVTTVRYVVNPDSYYTRWYDDPELPHPAGVTP